MADRQLGAVVDYLRHLTTLPLVEELSDGQLLGRFVGQRDEAAFAVLLKRHGPLVWQLCRNLLQEAQDAEDAFQATFLVLVKQARAISKRESVSSWLHGVAYRIAFRARSDIRRRRDKESATARQPDVDGTVDQRDQELRFRLHDEIGRLPEKYRTPIVLCYLMDKSRSEAAEELGWSEGTVKGRLERGRDLLRMRLTNRGLALSAGVCVSVLCHESVCGALPSSLIEMTSRAAAQVVAGSMTAAVVSHQVAHLVKGALKTMFLKKITPIAVALLLILSGSAGIWSYNGFAKEPSPVAQDDAKPAKTQATPDPKKPKEDAPEVPAATLKTPRADLASLRDGIVLIVGTEIKEGEDVPKDRIIDVVVGNVTKKYRRLRVGDRVKAGQYVSQLEDPSASDEVDIKRAKLAAAEIEFQAADKTREEAKHRYEMQERLYNKGKNPSTSFEDVRGAELTSTRFHYEVLGKREQIKVAQAELQQAEKILKMYSIRCRTDGVVTMIYKQPGEVAKRFEPVVQIAVKGDE